MVGLSSTDFLSTEDGDTSISGGPPREEPTAIVVDADTGSPQGWRLFHWGSWWSGSTGDTWLLDGSVQKGYGPSSR